MRVPLQAESEVDLVHLAKGLSLGVFSLLPSKDTARVAGELGFRFRGLELGVEGLVELEAVGAQSLDAWLRACKLSALVELEGQCSATT